LPIKQFEEEEGEEEEGEEEDNDDSSPSPESESEEGDEDRPIGKRKRSAGNHVLDSSDEEGAHLDSPSNKEQKS
jgi:hypothetical protein